MVVSQNDSSLRSNAMTSSAETLPILDFSRFDAGESERAAFLKDLREAARGPGFFYLTGHGVPQPLIDEVLKLSRRFFDLPEADKLAIEMINSPSLASRPG